MICTCFLENGVYHIIYSKPIWKNKHKQHGVVLRRQSSACPNQSYICKGIRSLDMLTKSTVRYKWPAHFHYRCMDMELISVKGTFLHEVEMKSFQLKGKHSFDHKISLWNAIPSMKYGWDEIYSVWQKNCTQIKKIMIYMYIMIKNIQIQRICKKTGIH